MRIAKLSTVSAINPRKAKGLNTELPCSFVPMQYVDDVSGSIVQMDKRPIGEVEKGYTAFQENDVLFAKITPCMENGKCAIARNLINRIGFGSTEFHVLRAQKETIPEWIYYYLRQERIRKQAVHWFRGTAGQQRVPRTFLEELEIPLPPLDEQERIAALLDKADRLRRLRRYALQLGDSYLQSVFLEMFGDPVTNPMGWEVTTFSKACEEICRYPTFYGFKYSETGVPVARIGNILAHGVLDHDLSNYVFITEEISNKYPRTILELNDILMAVRGDGSTATRIGLVTSPNLVGANMSPNLLRFKANTEVVSPLYLFYFMTSIGGQRLIGQWVTRTAKKTITATDIKQIKFPQPTPEAQEKFAQIVQRYERLRSQQRESLRQAEHLFESLLSQSFSAGPSSV